MKITIDTKEDSKEEIQKAIELLQKFAEVTGQSDYGALDSEQPVFGNIFDTPSTPETQSSDEPNEEEKKEKPFSINDLMTY